MLSTPDMPRHRSTPMTNLLCYDSMILRLDKEMRLRRETEHNESSFVQLNAKRVSHPWDLQQESTRATKKRRCAGLYLSLDAGFSTPCKPLRRKTKMMGTPVLQEQNWPCLVSESDDVDTTPSPQIVTPVPRITKSGAGVTGTGNNRSQGKFSTRNNPTNLLSLLDAVAEVST